LLDAQAHISIQGLPRCRQNHLIRTGLIRWDKFQPLQTANPFSLHNQNALRGQRRKKFATIIAFAVKKGRPPVNKLLGQFAVKGIR